jgi:hypothetical protein
VTVKYRNNERRPARPQLYGHGWQQPPSAAHVRPTEGIRTFTKAASREETAALAARVPRAGGEVGPVGAGRLGEELLGRVAPAADHHVCSGW